jgi:hypothetical protein
MPRTLSRRDLLKTGAIATAGVGGLLAHPESAAARALSADVVVVAGYAGVDTATTQYGSFSAAVQSGKRAAAEVLAAE